MQILKYKQKFSYGTSDPQYKILTKTGLIDQETLSDILEDLISEYDYSTKYRGIEYEVLSEVDLTEEDSIYIIDMLSKELFWYEANIEATKLCIAVLKRRVTNDN